MGKAAVQSVGGRASYVWFGSWLLCFENCGLEFSSSVLKAVHAVRTGGDR